MPATVCRPQTRDVAIQVDGEADRWSRARCRIFEDGRYIGHLRPIPPIRPELLDPPKDVTLRVDLRQRRRLCDCAKCVRHATQILSTSWSAETPITLGLRFVTLPGLHVPASITSDRGYLVDTLQQQAEKMLLVCSCPHCTVHRNFVAAWITARQLAEAGRKKDPLPPTPAPEDIANCATE